MLKSVAASVVLMALAIVPFGRTANAAGTFHDHFRTNGTGALAEWDTLNGNLEHYSSILADKSDQGLLVLVQVCDADWTIPDVPVIACQFGQANPAATSFTMDKKMNMASLSPTAVDMFDDFGTFVATKTVSATWTGMDTPVKGSDHIVSKFGGFREVFRQQQTLRNAGIAGSIDGSTIADPLDGFMIKYKVADLLSAK